ncbi:MAG: hypothetical protein KBS81_01895 [Spirochaetales bacterium]|nr:hypothetical protein [Candidatus Physcosoma equi]
MKKILLSLLVLLLLVSCSKGTETLAIASSKGAEIYACGKKKASLIVMDEETMKALIGPSGRDIRGIMEEIYHGDVYYVEDSVYEERKKLYETLVKEAQTPSILELWAEEGKMLKDTELVGYLDGKTYGFEEKLAEMIGKKSSSYGVYRANDVLGENCDYKTAIIFLKRWIKAIIG